MAQERYRILIAEDDEDIVELLRLYLESANYDVVTAENGIEALEWIENTKVDLAVVDIMMPKMDGYELIKRIRRFSNLPIMILSAKTQDNDKILGLNIGADDYLSKPFNPMEMIARIQANLRRFYELGGDKKTEAAQDANLVVGELCLDQHLLTLSKRGEEISLTPTEYKIIAILMRTPGRVYTKVQLYEQINGEYFENDDNTMMVHISKLREKIEDDPRKPVYIKTVRGLGSKIENK